MGHPWVGGGLVIDFVCKSDSLPVCPRLVPNRYPLGLVLRLVQALRRTRRAHKRPPACEHAHGRSNQSRLEQILNKSNQKSRDKRFTTRRRSCPPMSGHQMEPIRVRAFCVQIRNQKAGTLRHPVWAALIAPKHVSRVNFGALRLTRVNQ